MLTFLSSPKPFIGNAAAIQRNAIGSWKAVHPDVEVIIYGDGEGVADVCQELGVRHIPDTPCAPSGIPFFNGIVEHAEKNAKYDIQCYLNCDMILTSDITDAIKNISFDKYLITGQRIDLHEDVEIDVTKDSWQDELLEIIKTGKADLHAPTGMDYFIFPRGMWKSLSPLVIGRGGYDSSLVCYCFRNRIPFINATLSIIALHQFHDYGHQKGGRTTVMYGDDAQNNCKLHSNHHSRPNSADAPWLLVDGNLTKNSIQKDTLRRIEHFVRFRLGLEKISLSFRFLWRMAVSVGIIKPKLISFNYIADAAIKKNKTKFTEGTGNGKN